MAVNNTVTILLHATYIPPQTNNTKYTLEKVSYFVFTRKYKVIIIS